MIGIQDLASRGVPDPRTGCLVWTGGTSGGNDGKGRWGQVYVQGRAYYVHRLAYTLVHGEVPEGRVVKQMCGNRLCFEPEHLAALTQSDKRRLSEYSYPDHCPQGHLLQGANLVYDTAGTRRCRRCRREQVAASKRRARARAAQSTG